MSRSGYSDDCDNLGLYRATVQRAISGKRGQAFLKEMADALDAMPEKALIAREIVAPDGSCCAIGSVALKRGKTCHDLRNVDAEDGDSVAREFGIARSLACEIEYENDEQGPRQETPEQRWQRMRAWVAKQLRNTEAATQPAERPASISELARAFPESIAGSQVVRMPEDP